MPSRERKNRARDRQRKRHSVQSCTMSSPDTLMSSSHSHHVSDNYETSNVSSSANGPLKKSIDVQPYQKSSNHALSTSSNLPVSASTSTVTASSPTSLDLVPSSAVSVMDTQPLHGLHVQPSDVLDGYVDINMLDYITSVLRVQYDQSHGLLKPSYLHAMSQDNRSLPNSDIVPPHQFAVQVHFINSHYVVSSQSNLGFITVFDSLPNSTRLAQILPQLIITYRTLQENPTQQIQYVVPQHQGSTADCACFAVCNTIMILQGVQPSSFVLNQLGLRTYLHEGILAGFFASSLPVLSTSKSIYGNVMKQSQEKMKNYFIFQKKKNQLEETKYFH
ncbi:uncharacterized protein [Argopecten irradians]|uniref:uncharacterized protein n=1 Tax=Argopecten irradians TaxID=31199 RepID=UPI003718D48D